MFFKKKKDKEIEQNLRDEIYRLMRDRSDCVNKNIQLSNQIVEEKSTKNKEYIVLLVTNCRYSPKSFKKNRIKNNLEGNNEKFYLYQLGDSGYYTWILDIKYWDLFNVEIGSYTGRTKKLDNVSELISTQL